LQCQAHEGLPDSWLGNQKIDPSEGKRAVPPPYDPKGRKDLFQVLNQAEPSPPSSDCWMGHIQVDPSKGKKSCQGPEQRLGREDLFPVFQQVRTAKCTLRAVHQFPAKLVSHEQNTGV
jgi:hypothetical protein